MHYGRQPVCDQDGDGVAARPEISNGLADAFLSQRIKGRSCLIEHQQLWPAEQCPRDREPLLLAPSHSHTALSKQRIDAPVRAREETLYRRLMQHLQTSLISCIRPYEAQILADGSREQLRILRHKSDPLAQA